MKTIVPHIRTHLLRVGIFLMSLLSKCYATLRAQFKAEPQIASATAVIAFGLFVILTGLPTVQNSATLAGALFGAGASFIGAWMAETNRREKEKASDAKKMEAARAYFTPELGRVIAHQVWVIGRLVPNFSAASSGKTMPQVEAWEVFRPRKPVLYPAAAQFKDLSEADATALIDFYDSVHGVAETIEAWIASKTPQDVNSWNVLMQSARNSLRLGEIAVRRFCPDRELSPLLPASGTLLENIARTNGMTQRALEIHLERPQSK
jgi:hypothetical protein